MKRQRSQQRRRDVCWTTALLVCVATLQNIDYGESFVVPKTAIQPTAFHAKSTPSVSSPTTLFARRKADGNTKDINYKSFMDHKILTRDEEYELGMKIRKFIDTKKLIDEMIDKKKVEQRKLENARRRGKEAENRKRRRKGSSSLSQKVVYEDSPNMSNMQYNDDDDDMSLEEELEEFLMIKSLNSKSTSRSGFQNSIEELYGYYGEEEEDEEAMMEQLGMAIYGVDSYSNEESFADDFVEMNSPEYSYGAEETEDDISPFPEASSSSQLTDTLDNIRLLTEREIKDQLEIDGGRTELAQILIDGALAKQELIKSNVRLVTSIAKKWMATSKGSGLANQKSGEDRKLARASNSGDWTTPGMDEVIQQGIVGLAVAAERFEPEKNFKFSTYATYYITNEVRQIFQSATTQCLYVPPYFYNIKNKYEKIVRDHYRTTAADPDKSLSVKEIAEMLELKEERLQFILRSTQPLIQLDAPLGDVAQAGKAGGNDEQDSREPFMNSLPSEDPSPERAVEHTLLRQCIENALAAELLPLERDIVRLRHGLDDGKPRTVKEVIESSGGALTLGDVRTLENRAYKKLRFKHSVHTARLRDFAEEYIGVNPEVLEVVH